LAGSQLFAEIISLIIQSARNVYKVAVAEIPLCAKAFKEAVLNLGVN